MLKGHEEKLKTKTFLIILATCPTILAEKECIHKFERLFFVHHSKKVKIRRRGKNVEKNVLDGQGVSI